MRLLFIVLDTRSSRYGIMSLSAYLKSNSNHHVFLEEYADINDLERRFNELSPDFIAYSCMSGEYNELKRINQYLKSKSKPFVSLWGGPHPTFNQDIINDEGIDAICVGEGEEAILELCNKWQNGYRQYDIKNLIFKVDGQIIKNNLRPLLNIDDLPIPDFKIFKLKKKEYIDIFVSRGCYFNCTYCFNHKWKELYNNHRDPVRFMSVDCAMRILKYVKSEFGNKIKYICFSDDIFPIKNKIWINDFCDMYRRYIDIPFYINIYPTLIEEESICALKKAGLFRVNFAIESGNEYMRSEVLNRRMHNDKILEVARILHKNNLFVSTQNITCLPKENFEKAKDTFELNIKCRPHIAVVSKFLPFPKVDLTEFAIKNGYLKKGEFETNIPNNFHWVSLLNFADKKDKLRMEKLVNFFSLGATFPFLKWVIYLLVRMPEWPFIKRFYANIDDQVWSVITHQNFEQMKKSLSNKKTEKIKLFLIIILKIAFASKKTETGG